jgi:DNA polymerase-3 subunit gamma/tau
VSYQVFARKYRPQNFDSVIGQEHITQTLKNAIEQNRLAHAYLFVGPRGTGKTSTARILAKALNCVKGPTVHPCGACDVCREIAQGNSLDVLEIDGASNNGVEQVRELRENVRFAPTRGKYKIYIIDEVHMLTSAAFNALLKTLEEPPEHVKFVFATTEPQKVLPTILSRCQRFDLRRIPAHLIAKHLQHIAKEEGFLLDEAAAQAVARGAEGGLRDAESMLDQLVAFCGEKITEQDVLSIFGFTAQQTVSALCGHILDGSSPLALGLVHSQAESGRDLSRLMADLISHLRDLLVAKADPEGLKEELGGEALAGLKSQSEKIPMDRLLELIEQFALAETRMKWAPNKKLHFEIAVIKAIQTLGQTTLTEIIDTLALLRNGGAHPLPSPKPQPVTRSTRPQTSAPAPSVQSVPVEQASQPASPPAPALPEARPAEIPAKPTAVRDNIWPALIAEIRAKRPLISSWIEAGAFLGIEGNTFLVGFPKDKTLAMDSLARPSNRSFLEELIAGIAGRALALKCEVREGLVVELPVLEEKEPEPDPAAGFKNDPLIQKALEIFKGEIQPV